MVHFAEEIMKVLKYVLKEKVSKQPEKRGIRCSLFVKSFRKGKVRLIFNPQNWVTR